MSVSQGSLSLLLQVGVKRTESQVIINLYLKKVDFIFMHKGFDGALFGGIFTKVFSTLKLNLKFEVFYLKREKGKEKGERVKVKVCLKVKLRLSVQVDLKCAAHTRHKQAPSAEAQ